MIDHMGISVTDIARSRAFYDAALGALGMSVQMVATPDQTESGGTALGYGKPGEKIFWIGDHERPGEGIHVALRVDSREEVDAFHARGLEAGGTDNGSPGLRPHYGPGYYAAFLHDPDGANIEAVHYDEGA